MSGPSVGASIDDAEPGPTGFQYFGDWGMGESISEHYQQTAHYSNVPGSRALLFFQGTSVIYYADRQPALSLASVSIDGLPADQVNLTSPTIQYRQPVWSKNVSDGDHQLVIQHAGAVQTNIMIDYVTVLSHGSTVSSAAGLNASNVADSAVFLDENDSHIQYSPNNWRTVWDGLFFNKSSQITQTRGASFQLTFNGTAIWYFTDTGPDHGNVRIRIDHESTGDDDQSEEASGYSPVPLAQRLIWSKTDLSPGTHTINVTHDDTDGKYTTLDFFRYTPSSGSGPGKKSVPAGVIVGAVIAGLFFLGVLYCAFLCWFSPRFRKRSPPDSAEQPQPYRAASVTSDSTNPYYPYVDAPETESPPLGGTIPMSYVVPNSQIGRYPVQAMELGRESTSEGPTPAQVYRDSIRTMRGEGSGNTQDSAITSAPQMMQVKPSSELEAEGAGGRTAPPSYKR